MKTIVREVRFLQRGTLCFGDLYIEDGYLERIDYKTPKPHSDIAVNGFVDLHTHGLCGIATANQDSDALRALALRQRWGQCLFQSMKLFLRLIGKHFKGIR